MMNKQSPPKICSTTKGNTRLGRTVTLGSNLNQSSRQLKARLIAGDIVQASSQSDKKRKSVLFRAAQGVRDRLARSQNHGNKISDNSNHSSFKKEAKHRSGYRLLSASFRSSSKAQKRLSKATSKDELRLSGIFVEQLIPEQEPEVIEDRRNSELFRESFLECSGDRKSSIENLACVKAELANIDVKDEVETDFNSFSNPNSNSSREDDIEDDVNSEITFLAHPSSLKKLRN